MGRHEALAGLICTGAAVLGTASAFLYLNDRWKAHLARKRGGEGAASQLAARESLAVWWFLLIMVGVVVLGLANGPRGRGGPGRRPAAVAPPLTPEGWALLVGIGGLTMLATWGMIALASRPRGPEKLTIEEARRPRRASPWLIGYFLMIGGTLGYLWVSVRRWGPLDGARPYAWLAILVGVLAGFAVCIVYLVFRYHDPEVARLCRRAQDGDKDLVIDALRALIEAEGPSVARANALGVLLAGQERWAEAEHWFAEVQRLAGRKPWILASRAAAAWKLGRGEEALGLLDEARAREPMNFLVANNTCQVLAGMGRRDEAREALRYAEEIRGKTHVLGASNRDQYDRLIDDCRQLLADDPPPKLPINLDEL